MSEIDQRDLQAWQVEPLADGFEDRVMAALALDEAASPVEAIPVATTRVRRRRWIAAVAVAASLALAWTLRPGPSLPSGEIVASTAERIVELGPSAHAVAGPGAALRWHGEGQGLHVEQRSGTARYEVVPGTEFWVHTPAATVEVTGTVFTVEVESMTNESRKSPRFLALGAAAVGATALAVVAVHRGEVSVSNGLGEARAAAGQTVTTSDKTKPVLSAASQSAPAAHAEAPRGERPRRDRGKRDAALRQIREALDRRGDEPNSASDPNAADDDGGTQLRAAVDGSLSKDYIRSVIREDLVPLAQECYEDVLATDPKFGGKLVLDFEILGDENVGGIVDGVAPGEGTTIEQPEFVECMSESMMSVVFDPPEGGGVVRVVYPFEFTPG